MTDPRITYLSFGAGVQSSVMALMLDRGELEPRPEVAIFADTGWEPPNVCEHLERLTETLSFEVVRVQNGPGLKQEAALGAIRADLPYHLQQPDGKKSMRARHCTNHFKIVPIHREIRRRLGVKRMTGKSLVHALIGISTDEADRMKPSRCKWELKRYPLIEAGISRQDCLRWWKSNGLGYPLPRSACITCPFHSHSEWARILRVPSLRDEAIRHDEAIRDGRLLRLPPGWEAYLHGSLTPLRKVAESLDSETFLFPDAFANECEGICGV